MVDSRPYWCPIESLPRPQLLADFWIRSGKIYLRRLAIAYVDSTLLGNSSVHCSKGIDVATYKRDNNMTDERKQQQFDIRVDVDNKIDDVSNKFKSSGTTTLDIINPRSESGSAFEILPFPALLKTRAPVVNPYKPLAPTPAPEGVTAPTGSSFSGIRLTR